MIQNDTKCLNAPQEMKHKLKKTRKIEPYQPVVVARQIALTKMIQQEEQGHLRATKGRHLHCFRMVRIMVRICRIWIWITRIQVNTVKVSFLKDWLLERARAIVYLNVLDITWSNSWFVSMRSCLSFPHLLRFTDKSIMQTANPNHNNQFHHACQQWTTCCRHMTLCNHVIYNTV